MTKRVIVQMSDKCHAFLKQYSAFNGWTMTDVVDEMILRSIQQHARDDHKVRMLLEMHERPIDRRIDKECWGPECYRCGMLEECKAGKYEGRAPHL